jgi:putative ABC transport system ATP-binding protein
MYHLGGVTKTYRHRGQEVHALKEVSFHIPAGAFVTVTGGSGSGKTTLLLTLGGLIHPSSGTVSAKGDDLYRCGDTRLAHYRSRTVGFVLQTFHLVPYLTALENVMVPMLLSERDGGKRAKRAVSLLCKMGLSDRMEFCPNELSVGQQQRVAIARALANDPEVLLADEPTGNLDPALSLEILEILDALNREEQKTVILVTHSPVAAGYGERRFHLENGVLRDEPRPVHAARS